MKPEVTDAMMSFISTARERSDQSVVRIELEIYPDGYCFREIHSDQHLLFSQKLSAVNIRGKTIGYGEFDA